MKKADDNTATIYKPIHTRTNHCFKCGRRLDGATGVGAKLPKDGDLSICAYCGNIATYTRAFKLEPLSEEEQERIIAHLKEHQPKQYVILMAARSLSAKEEGWKSKD